MYYYRVKQIFMQITPQALGKRQKFLP